MPCAQQIILRFQLDKQNWNSYLYRKKLMSDQKQFLVAWSYKCIKQKQNTFWSAINSDKSSGRADLVCELATRKKLILSSFSSFNTSTSLVRIYWCLHSSFTTEKHRIPWGDGLGKNQWEEQKHAIPLIAVSFPWRTWTEKNLDKRILFLQESPWPLSILPCYRCHQEQKRDEQLCGTTTKLI